MDFARIDSGLYRALQLSTQDVWTALDNDESGTEAFKITSWRTVDVDVPSLSRWDVATSIEISPNEPNVGPP
jgi:hypothetical protein